MLPAGDRTLANAVRCKRSGDLRALVVGRHRGSWSDGSVSTRSKEACLEAAAYATGERSVPLLIENAEDPLLRFYAIRLLERVGSEASVPFLEATIEKEKRGRVHAAATSALRKIKRARR